MIWLIWAGYIKSRHHHYSLLYDQINKKETPNLEIQFQTVFQIECFNFKKSKFTICFFNFLLNDFLSLSIYKYKFYRNLKKIEEFIEEHYFLCFLEVFTHAVDLKLKKKG